MNDSQGVSLAPRYRLILFVAANEPNSALARENLQEICKEDLRGNFELEIVDVLEDARPALKHGIVVTPALLVLEPAPKLIIAGSLRDRPKVRMALRLPTLNS